MIDRRLTVLRMVAECGTVTGAAEALHYAPSAVSQQLRGLAKELGVEMIVQDGRRIRLTQAARTLVARSDALFELWEEVRAAVLADQDEPAGELRLSGFSTAASALLPTVASRIEDAHPRCRVRIIEADPKECFELLLADAADVVVFVATGDLPATTDRRFEQTYLFEDPLELLVPRTHRLASAQRVRMADLATEPWVLDRTGTAHHQQMLASCAAAGFTPEVAHQATEWDTAAALVAAGLGIALIPRLAHMPMDYPLVRLPLVGEHRPARHVLAAIRRGSAEQPLVAKTLAHLVEVSGVRTTLPA